MRIELLPLAAEFELWRDRARALLRQQVEPSAISWTTTDQDTLLPAGPEKSNEAGPEAAGVTAPSVPRQFLSLAEALIVHSDPQRFALAYRIVWRLTHGEPALLGLVTDPDLVRARELEKSVRRDQHKMKAFVRFREVPGPDGAPVFVSWFEPEHYIVARVAPFFVRRFAGMRWSILTPYQSAHWDLETLRSGPGATKGDAPTTDTLEDYWRVYYSSIFNPARLKVDTMIREMPVKYWKNLPEAQLIPGLIREALPRSAGMVAREATEPRKRFTAPVPRSAGEPPPAGGLSDLRAKAKDCRNCDLWKPATQTVCGEGPPDARVMIVGEQPGDQEDLAGRPFIGPAGRLFDRALAEAGLDRSTLYITNTVKHFKFEPRGKFRLHKRANAEEQRACRPWLDAEIDRLKPAIIVAMGSMAAATLLGSAFRLLQDRGQWRVIGEGTQIIATVHPSYLLRLPDEAARDAAFREFVQDLKQVVDALRQQA